MMAATSFTKNFKLTSQNSDQFIKTMTEASQPLFSNDFKSKYTHITSIDAKQLKKAALNI